MSRHPLPIVVLGALAALVAAAPAAAAPLANDDTAAISQIAPEISGLPVDGLEYRVTKARYDATVAALATTQALVASTAAELTTLQDADARLTRQLQDETARKKAATIAAAHARAGLRLLAVDTYVNGSPEPDDSVDPDVATKTLAQRSLTQAVSEGQADKLDQAQTDLQSVVRSMNADLVARTSGRIQILTVQVQHDRAVEDEARLTESVAKQQDDVERARVTADVVGEDFALVAIDAYWKAAKTMASDDPRCGITWWALAGITRVESRHGRFGGAHLLANGDVNRRIVGIPLDGTNNTAVIPDTDGGKYDGDDVYDRAVGPMQFIPSTWRSWAEDGNGDGQRDPNNIYDAADAAAHYLCASGPMQTDDQMRRGFFSYNHSDSYANTVLSFAKSYERFQV